MQYDASTLYDLYVRQKLSTTDIAKIYKKHHTTILYNLKKYNIPVRPSHYMTKRRLSKISKSSTGANNPMWAGGRKISKNTIYIWKPNHPNCNKQRYVAKHRLVMEKHLGRYLLPEEVVHHINGDGMDNRIENLMLFDSQSSHAKEHYYLRGVNCKGQFI